MLQFFPFILSLYVLSIVLCTVCVVVQSLSQCLILSSPVHKQNHSHSQVLCYLPANILLGVFQASWLRFPNKNPLGHVR